MNFKKNFQQATGSRSRHIMLAFVMAAVALVITVSNSVPALAGGMGGINVRPARVCLNGVRFTGTVVVAAALNRTIESKIFRGHVGSPSPLVATGTHHTYFFLNQTRSFTIHYPLGTFAVGDEVTYSALSNDGSGYGGGQFGVVENCHIRG